MTKHCRRAWLALVACVGLLGAAIPASADYDGPQVRPGFSIGGRAAYYDNNAPGSDDPWFGGAQVRWHFNNVLAAEGSIDYRRENFGGGVKAHVYPVQASLLAYLIDKSPVSPFLLGGFGWYYTNIEAPAGQGDSRRNRWGPHAGAGLQFFLNDHWSIDGTWRYTWLNDLDGPTNVADTDYDGRSWMATAGLNYRF